MSVNKRVFMFANYTPSDRSIGITKKISSEINTLRGFGYEMYYTAYDQDGVSIFNNDDDIVLHYVYPFRNSKINKLLRYYFLEKTALVYLEQNNAFDIGYIRLGPPNSMLFRILKVLKDGGAKILVESLAYFPGIQYKSLQGKYIQLMHFINHSKFKKYIECFLVEGNFNEMYGVPCYSMNMGVDVPNIVPHNYSGVKNELNLISVANENSYHAYDRVISSLHEYIKRNGQVSVKVHLVGTISDESKKLIEKYELNDYVVLYGKKSGKELDCIYDSCNVGLGPFGQHRVGGKKDTGLKTKEYFAKGLPYVYSGEEPTVPDGYPYIMQFPSDESPIDFDAVWTFYQSYVNDDNVIEKMRQFAMDNYSWNTIMRDILLHINME